MTLKVILKEKSHLFTHGVGLAILVPHPLTSIDQIEPLCSLKLQGQQFSSAVGFTLAINNWSTSVEATESSAPYIDCQLITA